MIKPHGSETLNPLYVEDDAKRAELLKEAEGLPSIKICSAAAGNAVMLGSGYFNPLSGYMNKSDALAVAKDMKITNGLFWPTPVVNMVEDASSIKDAKRIALVGWGKIVRTFPFFIPFGLNVCRRKRFFHGLSLSHLKNVRTVSDLTDYAYFLR